MESRASGAAIAKRELWAEVKSQGIILGGFTALLWAVQLVNAALGGALFAFGVHPRTIEGLFGILFAPFLHLNFEHLIANTIPFVVLGWFTMWRRTRDFFVVTALAALVGGLGTWLIGPAASVHAGASVLVFGYLGLLLSRGVFERKLLPILGSVAVFFLYGGALFGILPGQFGVSWQGHLFGFLGGILAARLLRDAKPERAPVRVAKPVAVAPGRRIAKAIATEPAAEDDDIEDELDRLKRAARATE